MKHRITLVIDTEDENPRTWDWEELIGDPILSVQSEPIPEEEQA